MTPPLTSEQLRANCMRISDFGSPDVLIPSQVALREPGPGQALVAVRSIGVNYMDIATREGFNPVSLPMTLGVEGAGVIEALGDGVHDLQVGQRVAWHLIPGSYADRILAPAKWLVPVPDYIDDDTAAGILMQGLTAQHLAGYVHPGDTVLVHSAAGGVGSLLTQLLTAAGHVVIARVSSQSKVEAAGLSGAQHTIVDRDGHFAEQVARLTNGAGVDIVFDGTGAETIRDSLASVAVHGVYAYYGGAGSQPDAIRIADLPKSILVTYPVVMHHVPTRPELLRRAGELFAAVHRGDLRISPGGTFPLGEAAEAHRCIQSRSTIGKLLLHP